MVQSLGSLLVHSLFWVVPVKSLQLIDEKFSAFVVQCRITQRLRIQITLLPRELGFQHTRGLFSDRKSVV